MSTRMIAIVDGDGRPAYIEIESPNRKRARKPPPPIDMSAEYVQAAIDAGADRDQLAKYLEHLRVMGVPMKVIALYALDRTENAARLAQRCAKWCALGFPPGWIEQ